MGAPEAGSLRPGRFAWGLCRWLVQNNKNIKKIKRIYARFPASPGEGSCCGAGLGTGLPRRWASTGPALRALGPRGAVAALAARFLPAALDAGRACAARAGRRQRCCGATRGSGVQPPACAVAPPHRAGCAGRPGLRPAGRADGAGGTLTAAFQLSGCRAANQGPAVNKTLGRASLPRPTGAAGARRGRPARLPAPTLPGRWWQAPASHAAALAGPARSGQTKRGENEASGRAGRVCSAPRWRCQRRLPRPGSDSAPLRLPRSRAGRAVGRGRGRVPAPRCLRRPGSTAVLGRAGLLRLAASILGAVPVASQVTNTRGGWQTTQRGLSTVRSCRGAARLMGWLAGSSSSGQDPPGAGSARPRPPGRRRRPSQRRFPGPEGSIPVPCHAVPEPVRGRWVCPDAGSAQLLAGSIPRHLSRFPGSLAGSSARPSLRRGKAAAHAPGARDSQRWRSVRPRCPADGDVGEHGQGGPSSRVPRLLRSR